MDVQSTTVQTLRAWHLLPTADCRHSAEFSDLGNHLMDDIDFMQKRYDLAEIHKSNTNGRGLVAVGDIAAGELVFSKPRPLVAGLDIELYSNTCANCFRTKNDLTSGQYVEEGSLVIKKCTGCAFVAYCSKSCQAQHWKRSHKAVCKVLKNGVSVDSKIQDLPNYVSTISVALAELLASRASALVTEDQWLSVLQLQSHADEMKMKDGHRYGHATNVADVVLRFLSCASESKKLAAYTKEFAIQLACAIFTNSLTLVSPACEPLGLVLDPFACLANHSCAPNAYVIMNGPILSFRAKTDISKGEEIYVSYIDETESFDIRQAQLLQRYFFVCKCAKCRRGPTFLQDKFLSMSLQGRREFDEILVQQREKVKRDPQVYQAMKRNFELGAQDISDEDLIDTWIRERLMLAKNGINGTARGHESLQLARSKRPELLIEVLKYCQASGQYEVYRQPYARARYEYILQCIQDQDFSTAWLHAAKCYIDIDPILCPEKHNPLRVVHTFRLAKLTMLLADETEESGQALRGQCMAAGLDMPILAWRCMKESTASVDKSHGADSDFSRTVKMTFKAAADDFKGMIEQIESRLPFIDTALRKVVASLPY